MTFMGCDGGFLFLIDDVGDELCSGGPGLDWDVSLVADVSSAEKLLLLEMMYDGHVKEAC